MVPESMLLVPQLSHMVLLTGQEAIAKEGQHPSNPNHLNRNLLHIVCKQNVHDLWLEGLEVCSNHCHVQLDVAVYVDTSWDLVLHCPRTNVHVTWGGTEEVVETFEPGGEEEDEETGRLVVAVEIVDHHVQVQSQSKHLTCKGNNKKFDT
jgi:hypothetical protein